MSSTFLLLCAHSSLCHALLLPTRKTKIHSKQKPTYFLPTTKLFSSRNPFCVVKASFEVASEASKEESERGE
jgi:hypothetical protein